MEAVDGLVARVQEVLDRSGLTRAEFAQAIGLDGPKLSKSLGGSRRFTSLELAMIAEVTNSTVDWLLTGVDRRELQFARRAVPGSVLAADQVGAHTVESLRERFQFLSEIGYAIAVPALPTVPSAWSYVHNANELAGSLLQMLEVDAIGELDTAALIDLIERMLGIQVVVRDLPPGCDGLAYVDGDFRIVVLATTDFPFRQRYTLAHEVAHIAFGDASQGIIEEKLWSERTQEESRANTLAASLLAPPAELATFLSDRRPIDVFDQLVMHFQMSPTSMAWRLFNEGLITQQERTQLSQLSSRTIAMRAGEAARFAELSGVSETARPAWALAAGLLRAYQAGEVTLRPVAAVVGWTLEYAQQFFEGISDEHEDHTAL